MITTRTPHTRRTSRRARSPFTLAWLLGSLILALSLVACGDSTSGTTPASATATTAQTATQPATAATGGGGNDVKITNSFSFAPVSLTVKAGTTVTWTNSASVAHTVTSDPNAPASFDSGTLDSKGTFNFTFKQPGTYAYHCSFHGSMHGTIIVTA